MKKLIFAAALISIFCLIPLLGCAGAALPEPQGYVNDFANLISDDVENSLEDILAQYEAETTNELAVVTVKTLGGKSIEEYTISLAEKWGVGQKDKDNGAVILVAETEREVRIEVGYGLEPDLTDARSKIIIENEMLPRFRNNDYDGGILAGLTAVIETISGTYTPQNTAEDLYNLDFLSEIPVWVIIIIIFFGLSAFSTIILIISIIARKSSGWNSTTRHTGTPWFGGGFKGGGFSGGGGFGGGGFGGGGASGRW
jgi:uncharacterized protein